MNRTEKIIAALQPWMQVPTWDTSHPADLRRFHRAVREAAGSVEGLIQRSEFETAMKALTISNGTSWPNPNIERRIGEMAERASHVSDFIEDLKEM